MAQGTAHLDETIGECGFSMIDMGDDGKIADVLHVGHDPLRRGLAQKMGRATKKARANRATKNLNYQL